jgi:hypothetical protein
VLEEVVLRSLGDQSVRAERRSGLGVGLGTFHGSTTVPSGVERTVMRVVE